MPSLTITRHSEPPPEWAQLARDRGTFYHDPRWITSLADCFGYDLHCLTANDEDRLVGGLALATVPALFGPKRLVSFPFSFIAGPIGPDAETAQALCAAARDLAVDLGVRRLEIKRLGTEVPLTPGFLRSTRYTTYRVPTAEGEEAVWQALNASSTKRSIRAGEKAGVVALDGRTPEDWLAFARLEEAVQQGHGVPAPPRRFFLDLCARLQAEGLADLHLARLPNGRLAAGIVMFKGPREWVYAFSAADPGAIKEYRPVHVLLWRVLQRAAASGIVCDLGRVAPEHHSLAEFKERWGAQGIPLAYDFWPDAGGLDQRQRDRGILALAARLWRWLPPPVARLGSTLYRYLG